MESTPPVPQRVLRTAGPLGQPGRLPEPYPFETVTPRREGFVERDGVKSWYAQYGDAGPWLAFAPIFQIAHSHMLRGVLPYLSQHYRVVVMDLRGNGRSDRPGTQDQYSFDHYHADFVAVLDRLEVERTAVVGISATAMTAIRLASEQPQRVSHLVLVGGWVERRLDAPAAVAQSRRTWSACAPTGRRISTSSSRCASPSRIPPSPSRMRCATAGPPTQRRWPWASPVGWGTTCGTRQGPSAVPPW